LLMDATLTRFRSYYLFTVVVIHRQASVAARAHG
jgi:hypothetical protein